MYAGGTCRRREVERTPKPLRRLELRLPESHPIFCFPDGSRAKVAAAWLDLAHFLTERFAVLEQRLADIEGRLTVLEGILVQLGQSGSVGSSDRGQTGSGDFDAAGFFASFE